MLFYGEKNVYEAGKDRIRNIFDKHEGSPIVVCFSGGKDSTVILNLTKEVMDERGIKKIPVFWCDQEIEAPMVVEHCRKVMNLSWVDPTGYSLNTPNIIATKELGRKHGARMFQT